MIKRLAACIRQAKTCAILTPIFVLCETALEVIIPLAMAGLIDKGITQGNMNEVIRYGIYLICLTALALLFGAVAGYTASRASSYFSQNVRQDMYYNIQHFSFANIDKFSPASLVTRLTTDVTNVQMGFQMLTRIAFRAPAMLVFAFICAFNVDSQLSLIFVAAIPFLAIILGIIIRMAYPMFDRVFNTYDHLNEVVEENLRGIRVVKSFVREKYEIGKFGKISQSIFKDFTKAEKIVAFNAPAMQIAVYTCMILISWLGAQSIVAGGNDAAFGLTTGELMSMFTYAIQILMSLMMLC